MQRLLHGVESTAAFFLLLIALLTAGNVLLRGVFSVQVPDWFDLSKLLMAIALFWGTAVATFHGTHICVDVLWEALPPAGRRWLDIVAGTITLGFLAPMAWMVWAKALSAGTQMTSDLRLPLVWFTAVAALGAVAAGVLALARIASLARGTAVQGPEVQDGA